MMQVASTKQHKKEVSHSGAFFYAQLCALFCALSVLAQPAQAFWGKQDAGEWVEVRHVIDGDTFVTRKGDKVRMIGINTPELGHGKEPDEPLGQAAVDWLRGAIDGERVRLVFGDKRADKYGRLLARVFDEGGEEAQLGLLEQGLAFAIAVGFEFPHLDEYLAAQDRAVAEDRGVWGYKHYDPEYLERGLSKKRGFARIQGKVKRISRSKKYQTLWLTDRFRVMVPHRNWRTYWSVLDRGLKGKAVEARGWVFKAQGTTGMKVYHPSMLLVQDD